MLNEKSFIAAPLALTDVAVGDCKIISLNRNLPGCVTESYVFKIFVCIWLLGSVEKLV